MRVLNVGGTGNISCGITKALLSAGHAITFFNRGLTEGDLPTGVRVLRGDRNERSDFEARVRAARFDVAIDMICYTAADAESDVRAFQGVRQVIHTSTVAIFGGALRQTPTNEDGPPNPVTPYARGKVEADAVLETAHQRGDFAVTTFLPAQTWGYQHTLLRQLGRGNGWPDRLRRGLPLLHTHDGQLIWSECPADDAGVAYAAAVDRSRCFGQRYILTRPGYATWRQYHDAVTEGLGMVATYVDAPADTLIEALPDMTDLLAVESRWNRIYDTSKIQRDIPEFRPRIRLGDRIGEIVRSLDARGAIPDARVDDREDCVIADLAHLRGRLRAMSQGG